MAKERRPLAHSHRIYQQLAGRNQLTIVPEAGSESANVTARRPCELVIAHQASVFTVLDFRFP